jgi:hypothetical protein
MAFANGWQLIATIDSLMPVVTDDGVVFRRIRRKVPVNRTNSRTRFACMVMTMASANMHPPRKLTQQG